MKTICILALVLIFLTNPFAFAAETIDGLTAAEWFDKGTSYLNSGLYSGNQEYYDKAITAYDNAIALNSQYTEAYRNRAGAYFLKKLYDQAIADYDRVIALNPQKESVYIILRGNAYAKKGLYDEAIADYSRGIALDSKNINAYYFRSLSYARKGLYDKAVADCNQAIGIMPQDDNFYSFRLLRYYLESNLLLKNFNDNEVTTAWFDREIERLQPQDPDFYLIRGLSYARKSLYDQAIADYDKAIALNSQSAYIYVLRANVYSEKGDYKKAIADYDQATAVEPEVIPSFISEYKEAFYCLAAIYYDGDVNPQDALDYTIRGYEYTRRGFYADAVNDFNQAVKLNPKLAEAYVFRGYIFTLLHKYAEAIADFDRAIVINPKYANAYLGKARACEKLNQNSEAAEAYHSFIKYTYSEDNLNFQYGKIFGYGRVSEDDRIAEARERLADLGY